MLRTDFLPPMPDRPIGIQPNRVAAEPVIELRRPMRKLPSSRALGTVGEVGVLPEPVVSGRPVLGTGWLDGGPSGGLTRLPPFMEHSRRRPAGTEEA